VGLVGAVLITMVMHRLMGRDDGELTAESSELIGTLATVSMPIRAGGIGEVIYTKGGGGRKSLGARSVDAQAIARDAEVVIVGYEKGIAQVQTWDRFIADTDELDDALRMQQRGNDSAQTTDAISSNLNEQP
jgi:membrane protein implicated in regulation of membrane protease activity